MNNATKTNETMTLNEVLVLMQTNTIGTIAKVYTDSRNYVGIGKKSNIFSINMKKRGTTVYCNDELFALFTSNDSIECIENANASDRVRNNAIVVNDNTVIEHMINKVINYMFGTKLETEHKTVFTDVVKYNIDTSGYGLNIQ